MKNLLTGISLALSLIHTAFAQERSWLTEDQTYRIAFEHSHLEEMNLLQLERELRNAKLLGDLQRAKTEIETNAECGPHFRETRDTLDQLKSLNQQYRGRANATYQARAQELKSRNAKALRDYKTCFALHMQTYDEIFASDLSTYEQHRQAYHRLSSEGSLQKAISIAEYIEDIEAVIRHKGAGHVVGTMLGQFNEVHISLDGETGWKTVNRGEALRAGYYVRTGSRGRARIGIIGRTPESNRHPTIINIAPNSTLQIAPLLADNTPEAPKGALNLFRGTIRAFTRGWGEPSEFSIFAGTSIGIRGTEIGVVYNPDTATVDVHLDHGDAYVEVNGKQTTLQPKTSVRVQNNRVSAAQPTPAGFWDNLVAISGSGKPETGALEPTISTSLASNDSAPYTGTSSDHNRKNEKPRTPADSLSPSERKTHGDTTIFADTIDFSHPDFFNFADFVDWELAGWPNDPPPTFGNPLTGAAKARRLSKDLLFSLYSYNQEQLNQIISGDLLGQLNSNTRSRSLKEFLNETAGRPVRHEYRCTQCEANTPRCNILTNVWLGNSNGSRKVPIVFTALGGSSRGAIESIIAMNSVTQQDIDSLDAKTSESCH